MQILNQDIEFLEENRSCSYFEDRISDIRYRYIYSCSASGYQDMLERGWRRFGRMHFVPECKTCNKCVSMRIDVANYKFSKSEKRVIAKNKDTKLYIRPPSLTMEHLNLYDKYHRFMNDKKGVYGYNYNYQVATDSKNQMIIYNTVNIQNNDYIRLIARCGFSFDTMKKQLNMLIKINEEIKINERLQEL